MCRWEGGGGRREGEIPRDLAPGGGEIPRDLAPGGARSRGGAKSLGHLYKLNITHISSFAFMILRVYG